MLNGDHNNYDEDIKFVNFSNIWVMVTKFSEEKCVSQIKLKFSNTFNFLKNAHQTPQFPVLQIPHAFAITSN